MAIATIPIKGKTEEIEKRFVELREVGKQLDSMWLDSLCRNVTRDGQNYDLTKSLDQVIRSYAKEFAQLLMLDSPKTNELRANLKKEPEKGYGREKFDQTLFEEVVKLEGMLRE